ncbi:hypothetical protein FACS1894184_00960 [Clostridia bacterium]|nr:hypothetical protein FACS1894184_00960 [Clostridia bacterium]
MDQTTALRYASEYASIVTELYQPERIVLYGSYANGFPREDSDIDVAVVFDGFKGDWWKTSSELWGLTRRVSTYIEPVLLDQSKGIGGFLGEVMRTGQTIYQR